MVAPCVASLTSASASKLSLCASAKYISQAPPTNGLDPTFLSLVFEGLPILQTMSILPMQACLSYVYIGYILFSVTVDDDG